MTVELVHLAIGFTYLAIWALIGHTTSRSRTPASQPHAINRTPG